MTQNKQTRTRTLNPERKANLLHSVIGYLQKNGFSKTLKRFLSETQIKNEEWKTSSLDLEVLYCKYLDTCNNAETNVKTYKEEEGTTKEEGKSNCAASEELIKKKKKKKKKSRKSSDSPDQREQIQFVTMKNQVENTVNEEMGELTTKNKDRKKKKSMPTSESSLNNVDQEKIDSLQLVVEEQSKGSASAVCDIKKEKKSSKKRKRLGSDESEYQASVNEVNEESRQKKTELLEESKKQDKHTTNYGGKESKQENGELDKNLGKKTSNFQLEQANGTLEKSGDKSASQKSKRKQHSASTEPKTVNVFQRVKIDEVEFADEKLQDNSYWAKDGSEVGYGAKAQEVLGQVRGRDFRHEKTKKKRGSYRGGQIEQGSHSIKFNYSDED